MQLPAQGSLLQAPGSSGEPSTALVLLSPAPWNSVHMECYGFSPLTQPLPGPTTTPFLPVHCVRGSSDNHVLFRCVEFIFTQRSKAITILVGKAKVQQMTLYSACCLKPVISAIGEAEEGKPLSSMPAQAKKRWSSRSTLALSETVPVSNSLQSGFVAVLAWCRALGLIPRKRKKGRGGKGRERALFSLNPLPQEPKGLPPLYLLFLHLLASTVRTTLVFSQNAIL